MPSTRSSRQQATGATELFRVTRANSAAVSTELSRVTRTNSAAVSTRSTRRVDRPTVRSKPALPSRLNLNSHKKLYSFQHSLKTIYEIHPIVFIECSTCKWQKLVIN